MFAIVTHIDCHKHLVLGGLTLWEDKGRFMSLPPMGLMHHMITKAFVPHRKGIINLTLRLEA